MIRPPRVALLPEDETQAKILGDLLQQHTLLTHIRNVSELLHLLNANEPDVLFCGESFQGGTWRDALAAVRAHDLDLSVIVLSRTGAEKEWMEVLEAGAFNLLVPKRT